MTRQEHLLIILSEECAEISKEVSKILRFGLDNNHPDETITNAEKLTNEVADLLGVLHMLYDDNVIKRPLYSSMLEKQEKVEKYLNVSKNIGKLT